MKLHTLKTTPGSRKARLRVGRGDGSGQGGTAGRGHKGQKSRSGAAIRLHFEGGQTPTFRRLPKVGFKRPYVKTIFNVVNVGMIDKFFEAGEAADETTMRLKGILGKAKAPLKILANGEITKAIKVKANYFSEAAKAKIEQAGGTCEVESL